MTKIELGGDNMGEIKDLYNNAVSYAEGFGYPHYTEWSKVRTQLGQALEELSQDLTDEQKKKLKEIEELHIQSGSLELERMFLYGFKCGARLIMDIKSE